MINKACDNIEAANILLAWPYPDAAANRLYYALYHAGWAFMMGKGCQVPQDNGREYFRHKDFHRRLDNEGFGGDLSLPTDWTLRWDEVHSARIKADYRPDPVRKSELDEELIAFVEKVVARAQLFVRKGT